jgi:hypothetical protein
MPVFRLPDESMACVTLAVSPAGAAADLESVRLWSRDDSWELRLPRVPQAAIPLPYPGKLPVGTRASAVWEVRANTGWEPEQTFERFEVSQDRLVELTLSRGTGVNAGPPPESPLPGGPPPDAPPSGGAPPTLRIDTKMSDGVLVANQFDYGEVAQHLGLEEAPLSGTEVVRGVGFVRHETGPDFAIRRRMRRGGAGVAGGAEKGAEVALRWAEAIDELTPSYVGVTVSHRARCAAYPAQPMVPSSSWGRASACRSSGGRARALVRSAGGEAAAAPLVDSGWQVARRL